MNPSRRLARRLVVWSLAWLAVAAWAQNAVVTLVEGSAAIVDGARRVAAAPGVRVGAGGLVDTGAAAQTVVRLEWSDGVSADLGPATRAMLLPPGFRPRSGRLPQLYLLAGWAKVATHGGGLAGGALTPSLELLPWPGTAVIAVENGHTTVFAEAGAVDVVTRPGGAQRGVAAGALHAGDGSIAARPPPEYLQRVPRAFRDPLPLRGDAWKGRPGADAAVLAPPSYGELHDWLAAEPALRRDFPRRFAPLARDAAFRRELQAHLKTHPEWAPLFKDKDETR